jgi:hypothetical protein
VIMQSGTCESLLAKCSEKWQVTWGDSPQIQ